MIAMALACNPKLLIADEPTTALDVTIQAQILELMKKLKDEIGTSIVLITHDLAVTAEMADRVVVMYAGKVVEEAPVSLLFRKPVHPYTEGPMMSIPHLEGKRRRLHVIDGTIPNLLELPPGCRLSPRCPYAEEIRRQKGTAARVDRGRAACSLLAQGCSREGCVMNQSDLLLDVRDLKKYYPVTSGLFKKATRQVKAVDGVSFSVRRGETLGLVGESGCGKTTAAKSILRLIEPTGVDVIFYGSDILKLGSEEMRQVRSEMQIIFEDLYASLNPRMSVGKIVGEPLEVHGLAQGAEKEPRVQELLEVVGLAGYHARRYPHEFSGGQRRRIGIARALALRPELVLATNRFQHWTFQFRRRSSISLRTCRRSWASPTSSLPTGLQWLSTCPTAWT